jgi:PAS domain-containing protein
MWESFVLATGLAATAILAALGGLVLMTALRLRAGPDPQPSLFREGEDATVLLFDGDALVDATPSGYQFLSGCSRPDEPWLGLLERLAPRFDNLAGRLAEVGLNGQVHLQSPKSDGPALALRAEARGGLMKITLLDPTTYRGSMGADLMSMQALEHELQDLRSATNECPFPMWRMLPNGEIIWANAAYLALVTQMVAGTTIPAWPFPAIFDTRAALQDAGVWAKRCPGPAGTGQYDVVIREIGSGRLCYATPAHEAVAAETALQDFKQTLTNTFAELSTGLAVFDAQRNLQMFNPALAELIMLPVEALLQRPNLFTLLDAMRDQNMIPEPKDYRSWRHQMVDLEAAAVRGEYEEAWHLPNGKAFRVVGRPYPNGAMALMIDDITDQITRDRLFQTEFDVMRVAVDMIADGLTVFSASGQVILTNVAYDEIWDDRPDILANAGGIAGVFDYWRYNSAPHPFWAMAEAALVSGEAIPKGTHDVRLADGRPIRCRCVAMPDGAIGILFDQNAAFDEDNAPSAASDVLLTA